MWPSAARAAIAGADRHDLAREKCARGKSPTGRGVSCLWTANNRLLPATINRSEGVTSTAARTINIGYAAWPGRKRPDRSTVLYPEDHRFSVTRIMHAGRWRCDSRDGDGVA